MKIIKIPTHTHHGSTNRFQPVERIVSRQKTAEERDLSVVLFFFFSSSHSLPVLPTHLSYFIRGFCFFYVLWSFFFFFFSSLYTTIITNGPPTLRVFHSRLFCCQPTFSLFTHIFRQPRKNQREKTIMLSWMTGKKLRRDENRNRGIPCGEVR